MISAEGMFFLFQFNDKGRVVVQVGQTCFHLTTRCVVPFSTMQFDTDNCTIEFEFNKFL